MKSSCREAWIVELFPAIYLVTQEVPKVGAVTDTTRPTASCPNVSVLCLAEIGLGLLPMPTIATASCWPRWKGAIVGSSNSKLRDCQMFSGDVENRLERHLSKYVTMLIISETLLAASL